MARRMYSIDQINSEKPSDISFVAGNGINVEDNKVDKYVRISLSLHQHNISISSYDDSMKAYMTIYSINSTPMTTKQELLFYLQAGNMPATGTAENNTKLIYAETLGNPNSDVADIENIAKVAHRHGVAFIIDNTFAPILVRPIDYGADIVVHSTTKYMDGHASCVGGVIVDSGNFDWLAHADKFPGLCLPDESYHGLTYAKDFGKFAYITKATAQLMRDLGSCQSPQDAYVLNIGLESLHVRMRQHCENAQKVAEWLQTRPEVGWIHFAGLPTDKYYPLYQKYLPKGGCGVIAFGLKGTREEAVKFMDSLKMINIVTHVADVKTCVLHPASHTHRQLSDEQLREAGIAPDLVRLSIGIEDASDIIADLAQALAALQQSK